MKLLKLTLLIIFLSSFKAYAASEISPPVINFKRMGSDLSVNWANEYPKNTSVNIFDNLNIDSTVVNANGVYINNVSPDSFTLKLKVTYEEQLFVSEIQIPELIEDKTLPNSESNPYWLQEIQKQYYSCQQQITALQKEKQNTVITPVTYVYSSIEPVAQIISFQEAKPEVSSAVANRPVTNVKGVIQTQKTAKIETKVNKAMVYTLLILLIGVTVLFFFSHKLRRTKR